MSPSEGADGVEKANEVHVLEFRIEVRDGEHGWVGGCQATLFGREPISKLEKAIYSAVPQIVERYQNAMRTGKLAPSSEVICRL